MKANHNRSVGRTQDLDVVSSTTKIVKWKQITTENNIFLSEKGCFQYDKDSKMKANHNCLSSTFYVPLVVSSTTKIVKWKQITTNVKQKIDMCSCFQYDKDSKMKANHNYIYWSCHEWLVVSSTTKIVKWKQITTGDDISMGNFRLFPVRQR